MTPAAVVSATTVGHTAVGHTTSTVGHTASVVVGATAVPAMWGDRSTGAVSAIMVAIPAPESAPEGPSCGHIGGAVRVAVAARKATHREEAEQRKRENEFSHGNRVNECE